MDKQRTKCGTVTSPVEYVCVHKQTVTENGRPFRERQREWLSVGAFFQLSRTMVARGSRNGRNRKICIGGNFFSGGPVDLIKTCAFYKCQEKNSRRAPDEFKIGFLAFRLPPANNEKLCPVRLKFCL